MSLLKIRVPLALAVAGVLGWAAAQSTPNFCPVPGTVTDIGGVVNTYYPGVGTAGPSVGPVTIQVGPRRTGGGPDIAPGDLLLIVQMQDATFNFDPSDTSSAAAGNAAFGTLRDLNSAGRYEYATATSVGLGSITVGSLRYRYTSADSTTTAGQKRFQVVRVARYGNARIISEIRALEWEGSSGGIVAVDVTGTLDFNGQRINVNGQGFRGGGAVRTTGDGVENLTPGAPNPAIPTAGLGIYPASFRKPAPAAVSEGPLDDYFPYWSGGAPHGTKGEGIGGAPLITNDLPRQPAGSQDDQYDPSGRISGYPRLIYPGAGAFPAGNGIDQARGFVLNAGGGGTDGMPLKDPATAAAIVDGNSFNAGGGGGSNAGAGGKGGNGWVRPTPPAMHPNAIAVPTATPGVFTGSEASGGRGGQGLAADATFGYTPTLPDRMYLGGGGGSGSINDEAAFSASGADGGGIVLLRAATVSGSGAINADGDDAPRLVGRTNKGGGGIFDDATGGGGGGGVIVVQTSTNTTLPLTLTVDGGNGGSTRPIGISPLVPDDSRGRHGPGGGGGGGIVYATVGAASVASISTAGGLAGTTAAADNYGARNGSPGAARGLGPWNPGDPLPQCTASLTLTKTTPQASLPAGTTTAAYTLTLTNAGPGTATSTTISDDLPDGFTLVAGSATVTYGGGATGPAAPAVSGADPVIFGNFDLPPGGVVTLNYRVNLNNAQPNTDYVNTARAAGTGPGGSALTAGPVSATVRLAGIAPTATPDRATTPFNTPVVFGPGPFPPGVTPAPPVFENDSPQCRAILTGGGRITLLDGNNPVSTLTVANQGTFEVQQPGNLVRFTPVQGFVGSSAVPYGYLNPPIPPGTLDASCRSTITVTVQPPVLSKTVDKTLVAVGEELTYTLTLRGQVTNATLEFSDLLPLGLIYRPGTSTLSGVALATEPAAENVSGRQRLTWRLTGVTGTDPVIRFRVVVTDRVSNPIVNGAQIIVTPPGGPPPGSPPPPTYGSNTVTTRLITSAFSSSGEIVGRVYFDRNRDDNFTQGIDEPLQGARVYLSNGRFAITDGLGRYSITNVETGTWAIRVDRLTVPYVPKAVPDDQGLRGTRYVRVVGAGVYHEDFLYELPGMLVSRVRATRLSMGGAGGVQIEKIVTEVGRGSFVVTLRLSVGAPVRGLEITDPVPTGATRGALNNNASLQPSIAGNLITLPGVLSAGTYTFSYTLTSNNLALDQVITDPDLFWDEVTP